LVSRSVEPSLLRSAGWNGKIMLMTASDIASLIDLSCVRTTSTRGDIQIMVEAARKFGFGQVSVLHCFIPFTRQLLAGASGIRLVGNVSFPSGSDSTSIKVAQAGELAAAGCDEIDRVMNIGLLKSGDIDAVEADTRAVIAAVQPMPVKVIIEIASLTHQEAGLACEICVRSGAAFVKTGTGWADRGTTVEDVRLIKSVVGDRLAIKASGGIRHLRQLTDLYEAGARRFGVNLKSGIQIVEAALGAGEGIQL
jgi:deoxyribose-phosphate aldolase